MNIFYATKKIEFTEPCDYIPRYSIYIDGQWFFGSGVQYTKPKDIIIEVYENEDS